MKSNTVTLNTQERFGKSSDEDSAEQQFLKALPTGRESKKAKTRGLHHHDQETRCSTNHATTNLVGTSAALEKPYMRLTTSPKVEDVRPLSILRKALSHIKSQFIQTEDFDWANEQLKSVRQDITVQHLRNKFVLEVYELHARILLEHGDLNEFNQCQTMIRNLTSPHQAYMDELNDDRDKEDEDDDDDDTPASVSSFQSETNGLLFQSDEAADEFQAYGLLYNLVQHSWCDLVLALSKHATNTKSSSSSSSRRSTSNRTMQGDIDKNKKCQQGPLSDDGGIPEVVRGSSFRHAMNVVMAVIDNDYQTFFRLYESAPHMSAYLMDFLVRRVRDAAYERIIAAYRPTISVEYVREALVLQDLDEARRFLKKKGAVFVGKLTGPPFWVDCKTTFASFTNNENSNDDS